MPLNDTQTTIAEKERFLAAFNDVQPMFWGDSIDGIVTQFIATEKNLALTFDACGKNSHNNGYDEELIDFLAEQQIPATLFLAGCWIEDNPERAAYLAQQSFFEIENHGETHRPLSVNGKSVYGIKGTQNLSEVYDEVTLNADRIERLTGRRPIFFRSGTAFYDDAALELLRRLNHRAIGYTIAGDEGATLRRERILGKCENPPSGAIFLFHMNHPESETAQGVKMLLLKLQEKGWRFVLLKDVLDNK